MRNREGIKRIAAWLMVGIMLFGTVAMLISVMVSADTNTTTDSGTIAPREGVSATLLKVWDKNGHVFYNKDTSEKNNKFSIKSGYYTSFRIEVIDKEISGNGADIKDAYKFIKDAIGDSNWSIDVDNGNFTNESVPIISIGTVKSKDGSTSYLKYTITFERLKYTGVGNTLGFTVERSDQSGGESYYDSFAMTIPQCVPDKDSSSSGSDSDKEVETAKPYVIVTNYSYGGGEVPAGQAFDLGITFRNTSRETDVENMVMTVTCSDGLSIKNSSNTFYIAELKSQTEQTKTLSIQVKPGVDPGSQTVDVAFKYQYVADDARKDLETTEKIALPVAQMDRFHVDPIEMVSQMFAEEETSMTVKYINKGRASVYNVSAEITGNIASVGQRQNIGNVEAGKSGEIDFDIKGLGPGPITGKVIVTYEDLNMNVTTVEVPYNTEVMAADTGGDMGMMGGMDDIPMEPQGGGTQWLLVAVATGVALAVGAILVVRKKKAAKLLQEIEDGDEDEDETD